MSTTLPQTSLSPAEMRRHDDDGRDLAAELARVVSGEVRFDGYSRMLYSTDASLYQVQPVGVVIPKTAEDVEATIRIAARHKVPVLPRGGGSSLAGQAVGAAIVVDFNKYMNRVVQMNPEASTVTTQPGISIALLNQRLAAHGLMLGPDPASANRATVGGSIGNNATGSHSILYGMMADNVLEVDTLLSDGSSARFGPVDPDNLAQMARRDGLEGRIYTQLPQIVESVMPEILARWPKHWRRTSGYNLDRLAAALLPAAERSQLSNESRFRPVICDPVRIDQFNLAQLITGS